jgi:hypothetical protein
VVNEEEGMSVEAITEGAVGIGNELQWQTSMAKKPGSMHTV